jgi:RNA polymerase sigma-70 factor (ECF subfamily)
MPTPFSATGLLAELPRLRRYARILTDDPERADRLVEETLAQARQMQHETAADSARGIQLLALLRAVNARNSATSTPREKPPSVPFADPRPDSDPASSGRIAQSRPDRGAEMLAQLRELPLDQREVLVLVAVERLSYMEIASLLHTPVATVISRLSQAREALRARSSKPLSAPNAN